MRDFINVLMDEADSGSAGGAAPAETVDHAAEVAEAVETSEPSWKFADDVPGNGEPPEWFKASKYKTVAEQAKAYTELEGRFGAFTGAPESYEVALSEELAEIGVSIEADDPLMDEAMKFAKESNMSQEGFANMVNLYAMSKVADAKAIEQERVAEIQALGPNADSRLANLDKWAQANLNTETYDGFKELVTSASGVKAMEQMISMTRNAPVSPAESASPGITAEQLKEMQFAKDEFGGRKISTDPEFGARYKRLLKEFYGDEEHQVVVR